MPLEASNFETWPNSMTNAKVEFDHSIDGLFGAMNGARMLLVSTQSVKNEKLQATRPYIKINFPDLQTITGIKIWNYNGSLEDTARGVRQVAIFADD